MYLHIREKIRARAIIIFVDVYRFVLDIDESELKLQTEETDGYMFATKEEIENFAKEGIFLHYDSIKRVFEQLQ